MAKNNEVTPMMKQFRDIKAQYPDAMLLFRCGDFYETYCEDAIKASKILAITLTHRSSAGAGQATEMAGFPFHALDTYLPKLVRAGLRVAICDQLEDPKMTKKLVKRGVTELVTPGVSYSDTTLTQKENNWVACLHFDKHTIGLALLDISTGEFLAAQGESTYIDKLLTNFAPKEVLFVRGKKNEMEQLFGNHFFTFELEDWMLVESTAKERLQKLWGVSSLKGFGLDNMPAAITAAGGILMYLDMTQHLQTGHIQHLSRIEEERYVWLDRFTIRNLELINGQTHESKTLYDIIDRTITPMGGRLLHRWIAFPLKEVRAIRNRQTVVEYLYRNPEHSFGIHVAKLAGMPTSIVERATKILANLESESKNGQVHKPTQTIGSTREGMQLSFFQLDDPILEQIRDEVKSLDINNLTPLDALNKLSEIKRLVKH